MTTVLLLFVKLRGKHESTLYKKALTFEKNGFSAFFSRIRKLMEHGAEVKHWHAKIFIWIDK